MSSLYDSERSEEASAGPRSPAPRTTEGEVLSRLEGSGRGFAGDPMLDRLRDLQRLVAADLSEVERVLAGCDPRPVAPSAGTEDTPAYASAKHLLAIAGKRLRPTCVALAARAGSGFGPAARELAVAVELVHNATLLHDDVIDVGELRRGAPTARTVWGNAASVYAGDLLLVEALERVRASGFPALLDSAFAVLKEMLDAESLQLANKGRIAGFDDYFRIVEGKTASLFGWALESGAVAGGLPVRDASALKRFGRALGVAFQLVDDVLDVEGNEAEIGKTTFADLREGKITHPLLVALERQPELARVLGDADPSREIARALAETRAAAATRGAARRLVEEGVRALDELSPSPARETLRGIALALPERTR